MKYKKSLIVGGALLTLSVALGVSYKYNKYQNPIIDVPKEIVVELGDSPYEEAKEEVKGVDKITLEPQAIKVGTIRGKAFLRKTVEEFNIVIKDTVAPKFSKVVDTLEYTEGEGSSDKVLGNFEANDISGDVTLSLGKEVDFSKSGEYVSKVTATDSSSNSSTYGITVKIKELPKPEPKQDVKEVYKEDTQTGGVSSSGNVQEYVEEEEESSSSSSSSGYEYSKYISIPSVGVYTSLAVGEDQATVDANDVCIFPYYGMPNEGKPMMLAGHENRSLSVLHNVGVGSVITIGWDGATYQYRVFYSGLCTTDRYTKMIDVNTGENMRQYGSGGEILQIYTCHGEQPYRWFVKAERI